MEIERSFILSNLDKNRSVDDLVNDWLAICSDNIIPDTSYEDEEKILNTSRHNIKQAIKSLIDENIAVNENGHLMYDNKEYLW